MWTDGQTIAFTSPPKKYANANSGEIRKCVIKRDPATGFGLNIVGGADAQQYPGDNGVYISRIRRSDLGDSILLGDRIVAVNGILLENKKHSEAVDILKEVTGECVLTLERNTERIAVSEISSFTDASPSSLNSNSVGTLTRESSDSMLTALDQPQPLSESFVSSTTNIDVDETPNIDRKVNNGLPPEVKKRAEAVDISKEISEDCGEFTPERNAKRISVSDVSSEVSSVNDISSTSVKSPSVGTLTRDSSTSMLTAFDQPLVASFVSPAPIINNKFQEKRFLNIDAVSASSSLLPEEASTIGGGEVPTNPLVVQQSPRVVTDSRHPHNQPRPSKLLEFFFVGVGVIALCSIGFIGYRRLAKGKLWRH